MPAQCKHKVALRDCKVCLSKCTHGQLMATCALCTGLVRAVEERTFPRKRAERQPQAPTKGVIMTSQDLVELGIEDADNVPMKAPAPGFVRCQFCHKEVSEERATEGRGQMRKMKVFHHNTPQVGTFEDEDLHFSSSLVSCPECVLNIKPQMQGGRFVDGKRVGGTVLHSGIKFRETDG